MNISYEEMLDYKFYLKSFCYSATILYTAFVSNSGLNSLHTHLFLETFNPILQTQYILTFIVGLFMVYVEFQILASDTKFVRRVHRYFYD